jgi:transcriptional repressor NrdR
MRCPKCFHENTKVYDTRITQEGRTTKRRRECEKCGYRFTTLEEVKVLDLKVEKRNGQVVDFSQEKLEQGIRKAYNKRNINNQKISELVQKVTEDALATGRNPIKTTRIGKIVLRNLKNTDEAAYICFGAMFWNFSTFQDFEKSLKDFQKE